MSAESAKGVRPVENSGEGKTCPHVDGKNRCDLLRGHTGDHMMQGFAVFGPRPVENSELRDALAALDPWLFHERRCGAEAGDESKCDCGIASALSKVEEWFASLQLEKDFERDCTDLLKAEISRLRADRLTPEEAGYTVTLLENRKRSFEVTDRPVSETVLGAIAKLSRISEEGNPK